MIRLYDSKGQSLKAGRLLGRGAQGDVYALEGNPNLAIKLYREPLSLRMMERLRRMVGIGNQRLLKVSAWPVDVVLDGPSGKTIGFLMPNFSGYKPVHQLFGVKSRLFHYPNASWPFLIHVAANIARTFSLIHEHGHIIGDVSSTNIMVSPNAIVALIDCDNYQVITDQDRFLCEGGTTGYVPSELIGADFSNSIRTKDHDSFGLAVLIFQLIFMGRHPFSGTYNGVGEKDLDVFVKERRFSYGTGAQSRQMIPPPGTLQLESASEPISTLFEKGFLTEMRPKPHEWVEALDKLSKSLRRCDYHNGHYFLNSLSICPWCLLERVSGVRLFNFIFTESGQAKLNFNLEEIWSKIAAVRSPGPAPEITGKSEMKLQPSAEAIELCKKIKRKKIALAAFCITITAIITLSGAPAWASIGLCAVASLLVITSAKRRENKNQLSLADSPDPVLRSLFEKRKETDRISSHFQQRWLEEAGEARFHAKLEELKEKKAEYISLPALMQKKLNELQKMSKERQLHRFLDTYRIADAKIEDIGPDKKITLQAYGFETATDIKRDTLQRVPGFSGTLSYRLVSWRQSLEQKFVFNPSQSVTPTDKYAVDQEIHSMRLKIEQELANGPTHLRQIVQEINSARESLRDKLHEARQSSSQADLDLNAVTQINSSRLVITTIAITLFLLLIFQAWMKPKVSALNTGEPARETNSGAPETGKNN